jgi:hypothetical protein
LHGRDQTLNLWRAGVGLGRLGASLHGSKEGNDQQRGRNASRIPTCQEGSRGKVWAENRGR